MDVAISALRASLSEWVDRARHGEDVVVTERGVPVARLVAVDADSTLARLEREGLVTAPAGPRPVATGRERPTASGSVSELITELRR